MLDGGQQVEERNWRVPGTVTRGCLPRHSGQCIRIPEVVLALSQQDIVRNRASARRWQDREHCWQRMQESAVLGNDRITSEILELNVNYLKALLLITS